VALALALGCSSQPDTCTVTGNVTWNGEALEDGDIVFQPADGKGLPAAGKIVDGAYEVQARTGPKRVEIRAVKEGKFDKAMNSAAMVPFIPERYNRKSELKADVTAGSANRFDFNLKGK
jgi:hypothetical protein